MNLISTIKKWLHEAYNLLFPIQCINCQRKGEYLCSNCKKLLETHPEICPYCHKYSNNYQTCLNCKISSENRLEWIIIPFSYSNVLKKLIIQLKYHHKKEIAEFLAQRVFRAIESNQALQAQIKKYEINNQNTIITFVPAHRYKEIFIKWYNQAEMLAQRIWENTNFAVVPVLIKPQASKSQVKLQKESRIINLQWKFTKNPDIILQWNELILLVDDLTTTWATLNEAAKVIKQHYPSTKIRWIVLWRHN